MAGARTRALKALLDGFYRDFDFRGRMGHDPVEFPHRYRRAGDIEVVAFIASCFAYGRVGQFKGAVERVLKVLGEGPRDFLLDFSPRRTGGRFSGIKYRFNETEDIIALLHIVGELLRRHGSLQKAFMGFYGEEDPDIGSALTGMVGHIMAVDTSEVYGRDLRPPGLRQFFPSPRAGSACKRANLFLRWMVRDRDIDFGIWKGIPRDKLVIPLDTHIMRVSRCLGFTRLKSAGWRTALEITRALKALDPEDPLKYDFALCHTGIAGICSAAGCRGCEGPEALFKAKRLKQFSHLAV
jgi:uncharacterized protein (TIGR02757 family)